MRFQTIKITNEQLNKYLELGNDWREQFSKDYYYNLREIGLGYGIYGEYKLDVEKCEVSFLTGDTCD